jgi:hypothetical protein
MDEESLKPEPQVKSLPSLLDFGKRQKADEKTDEVESLFYTCPQCGHAMVAKKCKIVCYHCHYFIGCVE